MSENLDTNTFSIQEATGVTWTVKSFLQKILNFFYNNSNVIVLCIVFYLVWRLLNRKLNKPFRQQTLLKTRKSQFEIDDLKLKKELRDFDKNTRPYDTDIYDQPIMTLKKNELEAFQKKQEIITFSSN